MSAIDEAWQPIDDYLDEQPQESANGRLLEQALPDESDRLTETIVQASVEGAALAAEGDSWAEVLRLYADDVLSWFPDLVGDVTRRIGPSDLSDFNYDIARYEVLVQRCSAVGEDAHEGNVS